ncbi:hypothetical protein [Okeania sp. SIO2B3]|nr:hypothetical protein [Okeania sp. SIO2B3]
MTPTLTKKFFQQTLNIITITATPKYYLGSDVIFRIFETKLQN